MTTHVGKEGAITVGGNTIAELNGWELTETADVLEDTELSDEWATFKSGTDLVKRWEATVTCMWDPDDATGQEAMTIGASITIVFQAEGGAAGARIATGTGIIGEIGVTVEKGAITEREFSVTGSGTLTWSDVP